MPKNFPQHKTVFMAERFSPVLFSERLGQEAAAYLSSLACNTVVTADFEGVEAVGATFLDTALQALKARAKNEFKSPMIMATNTSPEIDDELTYYLSNPSSAVSALAVAKMGELGVATRLEAVKETFEAGKQVTAEQGSFIVADVAKLIGSTLAHTNARLSHLLSSGSITRWPDRGGTGVPRYQYRSLTEADLDKSVS